MTSTPLETLLTLRRHELEAVEQTFSEAVKRENEAAVAVQKAEQQITDEQTLASADDADDAAVEAFSNWLPAGRAAVERARQVEQHAGLDREVARTALIIARAALEAVEKLEEKRLAEENSVLARREQQALDEVGGRQFGEM